MIPSNETNALIENEWLIAANMAVYNHEAAFINQDVITWGLKTKHNVGEIIYIYVSAPTSRIVYKCVVEQVDVKKDERLGDEFWVRPFIYDDSRNYINIKLVVKYPDYNTLTLRYLIDNNIMRSAPQGPRHLSIVLSNHLNNI